MAGRDQGAAPNGKAEAGEKRSVLRGALPYIGPLFGLIGISLALYFHSQSVQERVPMYYIGPSRATIVDVTGPTPSELQVLYRGNPVRSRNVVAATIYFWNDGRMPIRPGDVLEPITVELGSTSEILETRMLRTSRPVTKLSLGDVPPGSRNHLPLSFEILEKSDGVAIQIIYAGDSYAPISVKGTVVGAGAPRPLAGAQKATTAESKEQLARHELRFLSYAMVVITSSALFVVGFLMLVKKRTVRDMALPLGAWSGMLVMTIVALYAVHQVLSPGVPASIWLEK